MSEPASPDHAYGREISAELQALVLRLEELRGQIEHTPAPAGLVDELVDAIRDVREIQDHLLERATYFEQMTAEERRRYQDLFHRAPDAYIITGSNGLILAANAAAADLLDRPLHHLLGKPLPVFAPAEERRELRRRLLQLARSEAQEFELEVETRSGRRQVEARAASEFLPGADVQIRWILRDVTARRQAEQALNAMNAELEALIAERTREVLEASARLDTVLRELPVGVAILDGEGKLQLTNRTGEELLGLSSGEIADMLEADVLGVRDLEGTHVPKAQRALARALATGQPTYNERLQLELPNGRYVIVESSTVPVEVEEGVVAVVVTFQDVTAQEQRERAERDFVTNAAHELQTPIAAITSGIQVLQAGAKEHPADRDRFLAHIEAACARLDRLTRALLVLARAQAGHEPPRAELIEVEPLLRAVANALPPGAEIDITCPPDLAVIANKPLLEQALVNLGANAVKHTTGRVVLAAERANGRVRLEVRDEGLGIDNSERPRVFERFYRGVDDGDGFGLGLAIVAEAVRAIDGELELDSDQEGTGVSISLPAANIRK